MKTEHRTGINTSEPITKKLAGKHTHTDHKNQEPGQKTSKKKPSKMPAAGKNREKYLNRISIKQQKQKKPTNTKKISCFAGD